MGTHPPSSPSSPTALRRRTAAAVAAALVLAGLALLFACLAGSVRVPVADLFAVLVRGDVAVSPLTAMLLQLRFDRALAAFAVGGALSLSGVLMQALLRNPLADPYVLGVSGGAAVGALAAMLLSAAAWLVDAAAFGGAIAVSLLLLALTRRAWNGAATTLLLLTGVIVGSGCGALVTLMLSLAPEAQLRGMVFWLIGDLSGAALRPLPWLALAAGLWFAFPRARAINLLSLGPEVAIALGVSSVRLRRALFCCAALLTSVAVAAGGSIGFVGLVVPHACRFALGPDHRLLLPVSAIMGGAFLVTADTLARSVAAPLQLPVGAVTALVGVPVFLLQLQRLVRVRDA